MVDLLYTNLVGHAPLVADHNLYTKYLDNHVLSQSSLAVLAAGTSLTATLVGIDQLKVEGLHFA